MEKLRFEVEHYGALIGREDVEAKNGFFTFKTFLYNGKHYTEIWKNGACIYFSGQ